MKRSRIDTTYPTHRDWLGTDAKVVRHVRVCGDGHLAAATRIELNRLGIQRDTDYLLPSLRPDLVIACADHEDDQSCAEVAQRALDQGSALLLGCMHGRLLRLGPLIDPAHYFQIAEPPLSPADAWPQPIPDPGPNPASVPAESDPPFSLYARLGALLICAQALNFLLGARTPCVLDRAVEFNPWSMESKAYRVLKVRQ
jgi:hypothetical protein